MKNVRVAAETTRVKRKMKWRDGKKRRFLPFALQEEVELVTRAGDEDDELALVLAAPADGIETRFSEGVEKTGVLVLCLLSLLPGLLF
jgi:hypothetical protein